MWLYLRRTLLRSVILFSKIYQLIGRHNSLPIFFMATSSICDYLLLVTFSVLICGNLFNKPDSFL